MNNELNLDVDVGDQARALHRVVRAMHDGHCPSCGYLASSEEFYIKGGLSPYMSVHDEHNTFEQSRHQCPRCQFAITDDEAEEALELFLPYLRKSFEVFKQWQTAWHMRQEERRIEYQVDQKR